MFLWSTDVKNVLRLILLSVALQSPVPVWGAEEYQSGDVVRQFCSQDAIGKRLTPAGDQEEAKKFLLREERRQQSDIIVINSYTVQALGDQKDSAEFTVTYRLLGRIDSELGFTRLQTAYTNQPMLQSEHLSVVLSDTHFEPNDTGSLQPVKGSPEWRITTAPPAPHVNVTAALQYMREVSYRTKDPLLKAHAQRTLADLEVLSQFQSMPIQVSGPSQQSPEDVLSQFVQVQMDGAGLSSADAPRLAIFLAHPVQWNRDKIGIAKSDGVKQTAFAVNKAEAYIEYAGIGELDSQLRFVSTASNTGFVRQNYKLVFDNKYPPGTGGPYDGIGPSRWRIEDAPAEQWISVNAAIRYVTQMRDATTDPVIKDNAEKTLATLSR